MASYTPPSNFGHPTRVVICGGGASAVLLLSALKERTQHPIAVTIIEPRGQLGAARRLARALGLAGPGRVAVDRVVQGLVRAGAVLLGDPAVERVRARVGEAGARRGGGLAAVPVVPGVPALVAVTAVGRCGEATAGVPWPVTVSLARSALSS